MDKEKAPLKSVQPIKQVNDSISTITESDLPDGEIPENGFSLECNICIKVQ